jgi:hypothetical protein
LTVGQKIVGRCVFLAAGVALMLVQQSATKSEEQECMHQCHAAGKDYVYAPAGTVGRSIEGGRDWSDPPNNCQCVVRRGALGGPQTAK